MQTANNTSSETLENLTSSDRSSSRGSERLKVNSVDFFDDSQSDSSSKFDGLFENDFVYERRLGFDELSENEQPANRNVNEEARLEGDVYENDFDDPNGRSGTFETCLIHFFLSSLVKQLARGVIDFSCIFLDSKIHKYENTYTLKNRMKRKRNGSESAAFITFF